MNALFIIVLLIVAATSGHLSHTLRGLTSVMKSSDASRIRQADMIGRQVDVITLLAERIERLETALAAGSAPRKTTATIAIVRGPEG